MLDLFDSTQDDGTERHIDVVITPAGFTGLHGKPLPRIKLWTVGMLTIPASAIQDEKEIPDKILLLEAGTLLLAPMHHGKTLKPDEQEYVYSMRRKYSGKINPVIIMSTFNNFLAEILLDQPLFLSTKRMRLLPCQCHLKYNNENARSVNHAYTLLSQIFETQRMSHTTNVFDSIIFRNPVGTWVTLNNLRPAFR